jgi:hypothetical protein
MQHTNWDEILKCDDYDTAYNIFLHKFSSVVNETMPLKQIKKNDKTYAKPWITKGLLTSIINKNKLYKKIKISKDRTLTDHYKKTKNKLVNLLKLSEKNYYKNLLSLNKSNLKKTWQILNQVISRKKRPQSNSTFQYKNREIKNNTDIANSFNKYFLNIPRELSDKIPNQSKDPCYYMSRNVKDSLFFSPTNEDEILQIITNLKNSSPGYDHIESKIVKSIKYEILTPLTHIFNLSFAQGKVPDSLKIAKVVPIYKKGDRSSFNNYRPVSILPAFSKILEKLAYKRISGYLDKHNILYKYQFGFRKK